MRGAALASVAVGATGAAPESPDERLATLALARLTFAELERIHLQLLAEDEAPPVADEGSLAYRALSMLASRLARARREAAEPRCEALASQAVIRLRARVAARYAEAVAEAAAADGDRGDLSLVVDGYANLVGRGIHPRELLEWAGRMRDGPLDRDEVTRTLREVAARERSAAGVAADAASCWLMGTARTIGLGDWRGRATQVDAGGAPEVAPPPRSAPALRGAPRRLVTAIASLYRGGAFIDEFLDNVSSQSIFRDWCELIVVDAASPDGEADTIRRYMAGFPNIRYVRTPERIGIYEAWNHAIRVSSGELLTNTNLDDLRRRDSFELQASALLELPEADVVYQDVLYSLEPHLPFERVAAFGFRSEVPRVTPAVMLAFNPPHNAPMWRKRLHDELGPFDARYRSAGDYEFWLRCVAAGKVFHRIRTPHVVYYQNPEGISTRADTPGHAETREITARYARRLILGER